MAEWLEQLGGFGTQTMGEVGFLPFVAVMGISLACALFVSFLYRTFYGGRATGSQIHRAFPLLGLSITAIFICIQFSLPLSLGLLGALSIVRFRTPIKEPEEIGFIMLVVATSIACATFNLLFLGVILLVAVVALLALRWRVFGEPRLSDGLIVVRLPAGEGSAAAGAVLEYLTARVPGGRLDSVADHDGEATISYSFPRLDPERLPELIRRDGLVEGARLDVYFNRSAEV